MDPASVSLDPFQAQFSSTSERFLFLFQQLIGSVKVDVEPDLNTDFAQAPKKVGR